MAPTLLFSLSEELLVAVLSNLEARDLRRAAQAHSKLGLLQCSVVAMPEPRVEPMSATERELGMPPPPCGCKCATSTHLRWSLVQAAAWLRIHAYRAKEQTWLPRMPLPGSQHGRQCGYPSRCWLWALAEMEALKQPFRFTQVHEQIKVFGTHPESPTHTVEKLPQTNSVVMDAVPSWGSAIGNTVMRAGQHYCEFTWLKGEGAMVGVVTDSNAARERINAAMVLDGELWLTPSAYFFSAAEGERVHWGDDFTWAGRHGAEVGDRIGLLLDCDRMTVAVYINDNRLGTMLSWDLQAGPMEPPYQGPNGVDGPWCAMGVRWAVELVDGSSVRAEVKPAPDVSSAELAAEERLAKELVEQSSRPGLPISDEDEEHVDDQENSP